MHHLFVLIFISLIFSHCMDKSKKQKGVIVMDDQLISDLQAISKAKIFFGHQSVGYNIVKGLQDLNTQSGAGLNILEINNDIQLPACFFAHGKNGINEKPASKCDAFAQTLETDFADSLDIAFFKFCYIDINSTTDIAAMFDYYKNTISRIKAKHPQIKILHVTVPLRQIQSGWKSGLKKLLGKPLGGTAENIQRCRFNRLLLKEYRGEPVFDLAGVESTYPDGSRQTFKEGGETYYSLIPAYSSDGGHLNALGAKIAAKEMVHTLAGVLRSR